VARRADAGGAVNILEAERNAVQRPAVVPGHDFPLGDARLFPRLLRRRQQKRVEQPIEPLDAREQRFSELDRRQLVPRDQTRHLGDRQPMQLRRLERLIWCRVVWDAFPSRLPNLPIRAPLLTAIDHQNLDRRSSRRFRREVPHGASIARDAFLAIKSARLDDVELGLR
jgi:hypothetical protein